jgi:hypothetical protein
MEKRHTHWVNLWNANCDSDNPLLQRDLLKHLEVWEKSQSSNQSSAVMRKDFDGDRWSKGHNDQFKELIAKARSGGQAKLKNAVDKPPEGSIPNNPSINYVSESTDTVHDQEIPAKQMVKLVVSQGAEESTTDDDSLYRARTPPQPSSSLPQSTQPTGKKIPMFETTKELVNDVEMKAK